MKSTGIDIFNVEMTIELNIDTEFFVKWKIEIMIAFTLVNILKRIEF
jgi:hypothetical protein